MPQYLCDFCAHELNDFSWQVFIVLRSVTNLAVTSGAEGKDTTVARQAQRVLLPARDVNDLLMTKTFDQSWQKPIL